VNHFPELWTHLNGRIFCFCANKRVELYRAALARDRAAAGEAAP
jgi:hypothetical protein